MKKELTQYGASILLGSFIGLALCKYYHQSFWIGLLAGACTGWLMCALPTIVQIVKDTVKETHQAINAYEWTQTRNKLWVHSVIWVLCMIGSFVLGILLKNRFPDSNWIVVGKYVFWIGVAFSLLFGLLFGRFLIKEKYLTDKEQKHNFFHALIFTLISTPLLLLVGILVVLGSWVNEEWDTISQWPMHIHRFCKKILMLFQPTRV